MRRCTSRTRSGKNAPLESGRRRCRRRGVAVPQQALELPPEKRSAEQRQALRNWYAPLDPQWQALNAKVQAHLKQMPKPTMMNAANT